MSDDRGRDEERTRQLPEIGTKVVEHHRFSAPIVGEVVPTDSWDHPDELPSDSFIVEIAGHTRRYTVDEVTTTGKVVHIDP